MRLMQICCLLVFLISFSATASTVSKQTFTCPINDEEFTAIVAMSGTSWGQRLDLKKLGPIFQPWPVPVCPSNGFVLFKDKFSSEEIELVRPFVQSNTYQNMREGNTNHYLASRISHQMGETGWLLVRLLLAATWEAESDAPDKLALYLSELETTLKSYTATLKSGSDIWFTGQLLFANALRRQGKFTVAAAEAEKLRAAFSDDERAHIPQLINRLASLIRENDSSPRGMTSESDEYLD